MIKYAKIINEETGLCEVGTGTNSDFYKSIGMEELDVEQSEKDSQWYLAEKCPHYVPEETAKKYAIELENQLYLLKAQKAYGGVIINDLLIFETNQTSITNTVASIALMQDTDTTNWKYYNLDNVPTFVPTTKAQLLYIAMFARKMIDDSFVVEGKYNNFVINATVEQLNSKQFRDELLLNAKNEFDEVNNKLYVSFGNSEQITGLE